MVSMPQKGEDNVLVAYFGIVPEKKTGLNRNDFKNI